jgi:hypothetical protein
VQCLTGDAVGLVLADIPVESGLGRALAKEFFQVFVHFRKRKTLPQAVELRGERPKLPEKDALIPNGQKIETVEKTVSCPLRA